MPAAWRLATSNVSARPSRSALLIGAVALSSALIAAVACAIASANGAFERQLERQIGSAEARISTTSRGGAFDASVLDTVREWPGVEAALPRVRRPVSIQITHRELARDEGGAFAPRDVTYTATGYGTGVDVAAEFRSRPVELLAGRLPRAPGEVLIDGLFAEQLSWTHNQYQDAGTLQNPGTDTDYLAVAAPDVENAAVSSDSAAVEVNERIGVRPGDTIEVVRFLSLPVSPARLEAISRDLVGEWFSGLFILREALIDRIVRATRPTTRLTVVGISVPPPLGGQPAAFMSLGTLDAVTEGAGELDQIELELVSGTDAEAFVERHAEDLPEHLLIQTTEKVTSQLDQNLASNQLGFVLASVLAFLSAAFIIMTGLTTGLAEQERGLAVLRCIGGNKGQLAGTQLFIGLIVGGIGAVVGTPLGVGMAWAIIELNQERLPTGLRIPYPMLIVAFFGAIACGLIGATFPAWRATRTSPLKALSGRATPTRPGHIGRVLVIALVGLIVQALIVGLAPNKDILFWGYATLGLPAMFVGYFLLSVPVTVAVVWALGEPLTKLLGLPPKLLTGTIARTPFRHGFTAGAMMAGLALMIAIWTNGGAVLRDWLDKIEFPDAFVNGLRLPVEAKTSLDRLPYVDATCAITMHPVQVDAFGVSALQSYSTTFIAFEPREFFEMTNVEFVEGDREAALERLEAGGAIIVGREFRTAQNLGVGDTFVCRDRGEEHSFEIVGVVTSPGLELASKFFNIGEEYIDQSIHAVFGSRGDMRRLFGSDNIQLIQIQFDRAALEAAAPGDLSSYAAQAQWAVDRIKEELLGMGVLDTGSGVKIKSQIELFIGGSLFVFSAVAVVSMLVACFGVANLIAAGIYARRFEFGVLRAVGAQRGLLTRLVIGEAIIIGLTASIVGTLMGIQGAWAGSRIYELLLGLDMRLRPPVTPIAWGWALVLLFTVGAAAPSIVRLTRRQTRELLAAARG